MTDKKAFIAIFAVRQNIETDETRFLKEFAVDHEVIAYRFLRYLVDT